MWLEDFSQISAYKRERFVDIFDSIQFQEERTSSHKTRKALTELRFIGERVEFSQ